MKQDIKEKYPAWVNNSTKDYALCITDDVDSMASACLLQQLKGYGVQYFYDFKTIYSNSQDTRRSVVGVDMAILKGKCWDNHVTMLSANDYINPQSANLNAIKRISRDSYYTKYAMSTLLQIWSYYDVAVPESEEGKLILMAIDSAYKGHYVSGFAQTHNKYMDMLGMPEFSKLLQRHKYDDFIDVVKKYKLNGKIFLSKDGTLQTDIDLAGVSEHLGVNVKLPTSSFVVYRELEIGAVSLDGTNKKIDSEGVFSAALTNKNFLKYTK